MSEDLPLEIDVQTVKSLIDARGDFLLLDCRRAEEVTIARLPGAHWIPMDELPVRLSELGPDSARHIVVHCHHGGRSLRVTQWLRAQGWTRAQNMQGGIDAWSLAIDASVARY